MKTPVERRDPFCPGRRPSASTLTRTSLASRAWSLGSGATPPIQGTRAQRSTDEPDRHAPIADPAALDRVWIPEVAEREWLIITRDSRIQDHRAEIAAVRENRAKMIALTGKDARSTWQQLEVVMSQWRRVEELADIAGPFIWRAHKNLPGPRATRLTVRTSPFPWLSGSARLPSRTCVCRPCRRSRSYLDGLQR
jgi:hypothetical protein